MKRMIALAAFVLAAGSPSVTYAKSVHKEFSKAWETRDTRYVIETREALQLSQQAVDHFATLSDPALGLSAMNNMHSAMYRARYREGRGKFLRAFRIHIFTKPSPSMIDFWMQERVAQFTQDAANAQNKFQELGRREIKTVDAFQSYLADTEQAIIASAHAHGASDEIGLISQNLMLYYRDKESETARSQQRRAAWASAISSAFSNMSQQFYNSANRNWSAKCTSFGNMTRCSGE